MVTQFRRRRADAKCDGLDLLLETAWTVAGLVTTPWRRLREWRARRALLADPDFTLVE